MASPVFSFLESKTVTQDIADVLIGDLLGSGSAREVYVCKIDPSLVVKIENIAYSFQNVKEWETWQDARGQKEVEKWLAPCVFISSCGTVLLQKRAEALPVKLYPKQVPAFLGDLKYQNFGMLNGKVVAVDYGTLTTSNGFKTSMRKAKWWKGE